MGLFTKIFGTRSQREIRQIQPTVDKILGMEDAYKHLSEADLKAKTAEFKDRLAKPARRWRTCCRRPSPPCREAGWTGCWSLRPYPGAAAGFGMVLHQGRIAEMKTGEGKTLVATLPAYLNALSGRGVHVVTVNDYLAKYADAEWMGKVYNVTWA